MPRARLTLTIPEGVWIGDISRRHPDAAFRVLAALTDDGGGGTGLVEIRAPDADAVVAALRSADEVVELTCLQCGDREALVQFETTFPLLLLPVQGSGTPLELPFTLEDGRAVWEVKAPRDRLSALGEQLDEFGIPFQVDFVRREVETEQLLTDRQLRLLTRAEERGYYDTPRGCSLTELADELGMAKSTASETLHRAEGKVIKQFLQQAPRAKQESAED